MKGAKSIMIMLICLTALIAGIVAVGVNARQEPDEAVQVVYDRAVSERVQTGYWIEPGETAPQTVVVPEFTVKNIEAGEKTLTFLETTGSTEDGLIHVFTDEQGNQYKYDAVTGRLTGYISGSEDWGDQAEKEYTEQELADISMQYLVAAFGREVEEYELTDLRYLPDVRLYYFTFTKKIAGYNTQEVCYARIDKGGYPMILSHYLSDLSGLDPARVQAVCWDDVLAFAQAELASEYPMDRITAELQENSTVIVCQNGKYYIWLSYTIDPEQGFDAVDGPLPYDGYSLGVAGYESVYYEIP